MLLYIRLAAETDIWKWKTKYQIIFIKPKIRTRAGNNFTFYLVVPPQKKKKLIIETINAKNKIILQYWSMYLIHRTQTYYILQRNQQALESNNLSKAKKNHWYWINRYHIGKARYQCFEKSIKHIFLDCNNSIFCVDCLRGHE